MEEIIDAVNFEIKNSGYADKLAAGIVITGGGAMLKHLPQLMKFKTAMDVKIGLPNEHLAGTSKNEINQPTYATAVGLIMRGFEYLEIYKKTFDAGPSATTNRAVNEVTEAPKTSATVESEPKKPEVAEVIETNYYEDERDKISPVDKVKIWLSQIFTVEDQPINK